MTPRGRFFTHPAILCGVSSRARLSFGVVLVLVALSSALGCGTRDDKSASPGPQRLTAAERAGLDAGRAAIRSYCRRLGLHLAGRAAAPGAAVRARALRGARDIAAVARRKPDAPYAAGRTARGLAGDSAEDLEGTNCSAALVAELRRGL